MDMFRCSEQQVIEIRDGSFIIDLIVNLNDGGIQIIRRFGEYGGGGRRGPFKIAKLECSGSKEKQFVLIPKEGAPLFLYNAYDWVGIDEKPK